MKCRMEKGVMLISDDNLYQPEEPDYPAIDRRSRIRFVFALLAVLFLIGGVLAAINQ